jgi:hypothetical protein
MLPPFSPTAVVDEFAGLAKAEARCQRSQMIFSTRIRETDQIFAHVKNKSADMEKRHDV